MVAIVFGFREAARTRTMKWNDLITEMKGTPDPTEQDSTALAKRTKAVALGSRLRALARYFVKAYFVVALLAFARDCSPILPVWFLPIVFLAYALIATFGSMYDVVKARLHKQDLFNEHGKLSYFNRRWRIWFGGFFVLYLISAVIFVLQAPSWDGAELLLMWAAPIIFYFVFLIMQRLCKKQYDVKYYKAKAIKWSIIAAALVLTILYVIVSLQPPTELHIDLHQIIQNRYLPYANSPAPFLAELDKLSTYAGCLTEYGISLISGSSYAMSVVVNLVLSFSVFVGVVSQLGTCFLTGDEVASEFRLLPANEEDRGPVQGNYIVTIVVLWVVLSGVFVVLNNLAGEIRSVDEYTAVDRWVDSTSEWVILAAEQNIEVIQENMALVEEAHSFNNVFNAKRDGFINEQQPKLIDAINQYYDACAGNVEDYVAWYNSFLATAGRFVPVFGKNMVKDEFDKKIIEPVSKEDVDFQYGIYLQGLEDLFDEYWSAEAISVLSPQAVKPSAENVAEEAGIPAEPRLWADWSSEEGKRDVQEVLLGKGSENDDVKERIVAYIEKRREKTITLIENMPGSFFL